MKHTLYCGDLRLDIEIAGRRFDVNIRRKKAKAILFSTWGRLPPGWGEPDFSPLTARRAARDVLMDVPDEVAALGDFRDDGCRSVPCLRRPRTSGIPKAYHRNNPRGWCGDPTRGAALGRSTVHPAEPGAKFRLRQIRLDRGGYNPLGTYWGVGAPIWFVEEVDGDGETVVRASTRDIAKVLARGKFPGARFFR